MPQKRPMRAQVSLCAGSISGPAADFCMLPSHIFSRSKRGFVRDGLCREEYVGPWCPKLQQDVQGVARHPWRAQVSLCAGSISGPAADFCMLPSHIFSRSKRGFVRDGLCREEYVGPWCPKLQQHVQGVARHPWRAQVSLCAGSISGPAADFCMLPSHIFSRSKRGFVRDGLCRKIKTRIVQAGCRAIRYESPWTDACQRRNHRNAGLWPPALAGPCCNLTIRPFGSSTT